MVQGLLKLPNSLYNFHELPKFPAKTGHFPNYTITRGPSEEQLNINLNCSGWANNAMMQNNFPFDSPRPVWMHWPVTTVSFRFGFCAHSTLRAPSHTHRVWMTCHPLVKFSWRGERNQARGGWPFCFVPSPPVTDPPNNYSTSFACLSIILLLAGMLPLLDFWCIQMLSAAGHET